MSKIIQYILLASTLFVFLGCTSVNDDQSNNRIATKPEVHPLIEKKVAPANKEVAATRLDTRNVNKYAWIKNYDPANNILNRIQPPGGFVRTIEKEGSYADWLRHLPLKPIGSKVYLYNGSLKSNQNVHAAVIDIDIGKRDLQQCADAVMRVKAEYHYSKKDYNNIHFNYTSGDKVAFEDWRKGKKPVVKGSKVGFTQASGTVDNSYSNFKKYMNAIFNYAGTASLEKELKSIAIKEMKIGDIFIQGGFPGHAVTILDMATNPNTGKKVFMMAQSYMPAQNFHILKNRNNSKLSPWYELEFGERLTTPEWGFTNKDLKRFP